MALQFVFGNSGCGKTHYIQEQMIKLASASPKKNFLVIVPEQFTMQTQRKLVKMHPGHSILNIDVLSFARLAYRVFDELGSFCHQVLEDTGKNLILRHVAQEKADTLTVLRKNMARMGYIGEMKSLLSELAQYNISPSQLAETIEKLPQGSFSYKLSDILTMYEGFLESLKGRFVTAEEVLELLSDVAGESQILRGSVIAFDGFTGFTPIQNELLKKLMGLADTIYVTVAIDIREDFYRSAGSHELFAMSKKMIRSLREMAQGLHIPVLEPVLLSHSKNSRFASSDALLFLEQNLFRGRAGRFNLPGQGADIGIYSTKNPRRELHFVAREIERLIRECGYCYREIAIVCGDLPGYANYAKEVFDVYKIPLFLDQKTTLSYHPFIAFLQASLDVILYDFSREAVFRYLRCSLSGFLARDVDVLENYCVAAGIRGYSKWKEAFCYLPKGFDEESLMAVNQAREAVASQFENLRKALKEKGVTVEGQTKAFYRFICEREAQQKLKQRQGQYEAAGDLKNAKEYAQIYRIVMDLFDKLVLLLGGEVISLEEFARILDTGYEEARVGILPPGYDRVVFGDMERTRLDSIRVLFVAGVNDGVIPKAGGADGILSEAEREILGQMQIELSPTVRQKTFIQKFYLYLNLTKPKEKLYLTYARVDGEGKALRASYLVRTVLKLYNNLAVTELLEEPLKDRIVTPENARELLVEGLIKGTEWQKGEKEEELTYWAALCRWYGARAKWKKEVSRLFYAAKLTHTDTPVSAAVTKALYGTELINSVTRLEQFAACAFSHFLSYGLKLKERQESGFYAVDIGNVFHEALLYYAEGIKGHGYDWFTVTDEESEALLKEAMERAIGENHNPSLYANARSSYAKERIFRILKRTVAALLYQVRQGRFAPEGFEVSFAYAGDLKAVHFKLSEEEKMHLRGRIDRIDTCGDEDKLYVKIIDYKSGNTSFQFLNVYYGLQLQLVVYMNAALELMEQKNPGKEAVPAGIFYYHVNDPVIEVEEDIDEEELRKKILGELKLNGVANADPAVLGKLDTALEHGQGVSSGVIPVGFNKDGSLKKTSKVLETKDFAVLSSYVNETILHLGQRIMQGDIGVSPYALAGKSGCDYCAYRPVCQFDTKVPGFSYRRLTELSEEELLMRMRGEEA